MTRNAENIVPPNCISGLTLKLCVTRKPSDVMNSTIRKSSSIPVTVQLRTPCRSSLMTMGFNSQSRQLAKWFLQRANVEEVELTIEARKL